MNGRVVSPDDRPCLNAKARLRDDPVRGTVVLLYPEGVLLLNSSAGAVLALCDGRKVTAIVNELAGRYLAQADSVAADVADLLERLYERGLIGFIEMEDDG
jgi:pyrroloquinoline quinone biosynthesis protein D